MSFQVIPLPAKDFAPLFALSEAELAARGIERVVADTPVGFPCRVSLDDAAPGSELLLLNFEHQPAPTPYRSAHAIFVGRGPTAACAPGEVPSALARRTLSVRAFDAEGRMLDADLVEGAEAGVLFQRLLSDPRAAYLHAHYARRGCYAARVERV